MNQLTQTQANNIPNTVLARKGPVAALLHQAQKQITSLLSGDSTRANKFMAAALQVGNDPNLSNYSPDSIVQAIIGVAMLDLNIDKNVGHCYIVPYKGKAQLQVGYKGMIQLLFRAGWFVKAFPIYHCDEFSITFDGWENKIIMTPALDERDEADRAWVIDNLRGIWVIARHTETNSEASLFVPKKVIEKLRMVSPNQKGPAPSGIWYDWYAEMAMGKAIKRLAKTLPLGDQRAALAMAADDKADMGKAVNFKASAESGVIIEQDGDDSGQDVTQESLLAAIESAQNQGDLDKLKADINALPASLKRTTREAWAVKADALKHGEQPAGTESNNAQPAETVSTDTQKQPAAALSWKERVLQCNDYQELVRLSTEEMPEMEQIELDALIDERLDFLRSR